MTDHLKAQWRAQQTRYKVRNMEARNRALSKEREKRIPKELYDARLHGWHLHELNLRQEWKSFKGGNYMPCLLSSAALPSLPVRV